MPFIPVNNTAQVRLEGIVDGCQTINDLYFRQPGGIFFADIQSLVVNMDAWFTTAFAENLSNQWSTVAVHARDLTLETGLVADFASAPTAGGEGSEPAPNNVAACISFRTGTAGRSFRGRNYVPAVPNSLITTNTLESGWMGAIRAAYELLLPGGGALPGDWEWVIASRYSGVDVDGKPIPRVAGVATPVSTVVWTNATVDSMRSRLPGRGK